MILLSIWLFLLFITTTHISASNLAPKLDEFKPRRSQNIGTTMKILCSLQEGSRPFHFEWFKNELKLPQPSYTSYQIQISEDDSLLIIEKLSPSDSGKYSCQVKNDFGIDTQRTELLVKGLMLVFSFVFSFDSSTICGADNAMFISLLFFDGFIFVILSQFKQISHLFQL